MDKKKIIEYVILLVIVLILIFIYSNGSGKQLITDKRKEEFANYANDRILVLKKYLERNDAFPKEENEAVIVGLSNKIFTDDKSPSGAKLDKGYSYIIVAASTIEEELKYSYFIQILDKDGYFIPLMEEKKIKEQKPLNIDSVDFSISTIENLFKPVTNEDKEISMDYNQIVSYLENGEDKYITINSNSNNLEYFGDYTGKCDEVKCFKITKVI